jgi:MFS family permease
MNTSPRKIFGLHPNIFFLGLVSLLTDVSSEMIFTIMPLFVVNVLGAGATAVGLIGGLSDATDAILRIFSGRISDKLKKRKLLAVLGYGFSTIVKPFMYFATTWGATLAVRFGDRIGKGLRTSPRDALVADSVEATQRGRGFGIHRAMDTTGAFLGLVIAAVIIYHLQGGGLKLELKTYQWLVLVGVIPAVLAVIVLLGFVHERKQKPIVITTGQSAPIAKTDEKFDTRFKLFLVVMGIFSLGNSSDFFIILRAQDLGSSVLYITIMLVLFNLTYALVSTPAGILSDKIGRRRVIILGWFIYAIVYLGFALSNSVWITWVLFAAYGVYYGVAEGAAKAFVADLVPADRRGTAYGYYNGVVGIMLLPASVLAGLFWDKISPATPFYLGAGLAFIAMLGLMTLVKEKKVEEKHS